MDLERASLKALFYDYHIEHLVNLMLGDFQGNRSVNYT